MTSTALSEFESQPGLGFGVVDQAFLDSLGHEQYLDRYVNLYRSAVFNYYIHELERTTQDPDLVNRSGRFNEAGYRAYSDEQLSKHANAEELLASDPDEDRRLVVMAFEVDGGTSESEGPRRFTEDEIGSAVGMMIVKRTVSGLHVAELDVHPDYRHNPDAERHRRLGHALAELTTVHVLSAAEDDMSVTLEVGGDNLARGVWTAWGFEPNGEPEINQLYPYRNALEVIKWYGMDEYVRRHGQHPMVTQLGDWRERLEAQSALAA